MGFFSQLFGIDKRRAKAFAQAEKEREERVQLMYAEREQRRLKMEKKMDDLAKQSAQAKPIEQANSRTKPYTAPRTTPDHSTPTRYNDDSWTAIALATSHSSPSYSSSNDSDSSRSCSSPSYDSSSSASSDSSSCSSDTSSF